MFENHVTLIALEARGCNGNRIICSQIVVFNEDCSGIRNHRQIRKDVLRCRIACIDNDVVYVTNGDAFAILNRDDAITIGNGAIGSIDWLVEIISCIKRDISSCFKVGIARNDESESCHSTLSYVTRRDVFTCL